MGMRILLTGGGTGGHINPAIAIAQYVREHEKDAVILYAGTPNGMEAELVKKAGFDFAPIEVKGFSRSLAPRDILHNISAVQKAFAAKPRAKKILKGFRPDIVVGTGGYVSGPVLLEATKMGIKTALHEQNAFPGVTNRLLASKVDIVFLAVEEAKSRLANAKACEVVGNPIREGVITKSKTEAKAELKLDDKLCILSYGGSLGANGINRLAADLIEWHHGGDEINHIHAYGRNGKNNFPQMLKERGVDISKSHRIRTLEYIDNMDTCMAAADILICRAGAITISEVEATGKPAIFVPSPNVTENHQYHNAMVLVNKHAALMIEEKEYTKQKVVSMVEKLLNDRNELAELSKNASSLAILDTSKRIYDGIKGLINSK